MAPKKASAKSKAASRQTRKKRRNSDISSEDGGAAVQTPIAGKRQKQHDTRSHDSDDESVKSNNVGPAPSQEPEQQTILAGTAQEALEAMSQEPKTNTNTQDTPAQQVRFNLFDHKQISQKLMIKRRRTLSPHTGGRVKHFKLAGRKSMPFISNIASGQAENLRLQPLRSVLDEQIRKLDEKQADADLSAASSDADDDMLVLDPSHTRINEELSDVADEITATTSIVQSDERDVIANHKQFDLERARLEKVILDKTNEAAEAKSRLELFTIELRSLGLSEDNDLPPVQAMRDFFLCYRDGLADFMPKEVTDEATNAEFLEILSQTLQNFIQDWDKQTAELRENADLIDELRTQVTKLTKLLASKEIEQRKLVNTDDEQQAMITKLQIELNSAMQKAAQADELSNTLAQKITNLEEENTFHQSTIDSQKQSLQNYMQTEKDSDSLVQSLESTIEKMNEHYQETVTKMNAEREETVQTLEEHIDVESERHAEALARAKEAEHKINVRNEKIAQHLLEIEALKERNASLESQLEAVTTERDDAQLDAREASEALQTSSADYEAEYDSLRRSVSGNQVQLYECREAFDKQLDQLVVQNGTLSFEMQQLNSDKASLERRVETEAEEMLILQAEKDQEIAILEKELDEYRTLAHNVEVKAGTADQRWQDVYNEKTLALEHTQHLLATADDYNMALEQELDAIKIDFRAYQTETQRRFQSIRDDMTAVRRNTDYYIEENDQAVEKYNMLMKQGSVKEVMAQGDELTEQLEQSQRTAISKKSRTRDSGYGMASDELEAETPA